MLPRKQSGRIQWLSGIAKLESSPNVPDTLRLGLDPIPKSRELTSPQCPMGQPETAMLFVSRAWPFSLTVLSDSILRQGRHFVRYVAIDKRNGRRFPAHLTWIKAACALNG
jgi:hypothetical protein